MAVNVVKVELLGASFSVQTDETREYIETLLGELDRRIDSLRVATRVEDPLRLSILANISILDELVRNRGQSGDADEVSRIAERLIGRIDRSLDGIP
ncbi:MAG TPA: cell division protein ZapA [Rectinemataceae bacterium]|nr:cell division protein ZapA [Rectinemataceae bacterium]